MLLQTIDMNTKIIKHKINKLDNFSHIFAL
jgi:hypothetical protein